LRARKKPEVLLFMAVVFLRLVEEEGYSAGVLGLGTFYRLYFG